MISNAVMRSMDEAILAFAKSEDFVYTRYADDLIFSTKKKGVTKRFLVGLRKVISRCKHPRLTINEGKTMFLSRKCRRAVTGLVISPDGRVSVGRGLKRRLRARVNDFRRSRLPEHEKHRLQGYLAFILGVEPDFYNRLCQKYGAAVLNGAMRCRGDREA